MTMAAAMSFRSSFFSFSVLEKPSSQFNFQLKLSTNEKEKKKNRKLRCELPQQEWKRSNDNARHLIKDNARRESQLRKNQGNVSRSPSWILKKRTPYQMPQFLTEDRHSRKYQRHVAAATRTVRKLDSKPPGSYNIRHVLKAFNDRLSFRDMCVVLKEQRGWRPAAEFFAWMKLQFREAEGFIRESTEDEIVLDIIAYNTFIKAKLDAGKIKEAIDLYNDMKAAGIVPSLQTYNTMISVYGKARELQNAVQIFNSLQKSVLSVDEKTFSNMISCYGKAGFFQDAAELFSRMQQEGIKPGKVSKINWKTNKVHS